MKPLITGLEIDSTTDSVNNNRSHLKIELNNVINIDMRKNRLLKLERLKLPMVIYNITSVKGNHTIRYSVNSGVLYKIIEFEDGIYTATDINSRIRAELVSNDDIEVDAETQRNIYPFAMGYNSSSSKGYLMINTLFSTYTNVRVDISNDSTSTMYLLFGFTIAQVNLDGSASQQTISINHMNIYDSQFYIWCNIVSSYKSGIKTGQSLYLGSLNGTFNGYLFLKPEDQIYALIGTNEISNIEIKFMDRNNDLLVFSDNSLDSNITMSLSIY